MIVYHGILTLHALNAAANTKVFGNMLPSLHQLIINRKWLQDDTGDVSSIHTFATISYFGSAFLMLRQLML